MARCGISAGAGQGNDQYSNSPAVKTLGVGSNLLGLHDVKLDYPFGRFEFADLHGFSRLRNIT